ncbi:MAG: carbohydrate ABC transporter permease [Candidatus Omnitrophica bacterium]|nr:carbohydrate ABC transporter permease [Candidatus Omnitrophota bacterium]
MDSERLKYQFRNFSIGSLLNLFLLLVAASCLFPLFWTFSTSLKTQSQVFSDMSLIPKAFHWENYYLAWTEGSFGVYFLNSVLYTICTVIGIVLVSSLAAYAFSRLKFPGRNLFFFMFLAAMMIPLPGSFVPLYIVMKKLHLLNTPQGYVLCMINVGLSLSIFLLKTFFDKMPTDLEDAARIDGCSKLGIWWNVALPLARPALAVIVIFNSLTVWNEYILALIIFDDTRFMPLQVGLSTFHGEFVTQYPLLMAGIIITVIPILLIYILLQKHIVKGLTAGAVVG